MGSVERDAQLEVRRGTDVRAVQSTAGLFWAELRRRAASGTVVGGVGVEISQCRVCSGCVRGGSAQALGHGGVAGAVCACSGAMRRRRMRMG